MAMKIETVYAALDSLLDYAKDCGLLHPLDETFARNALLAELKLESYEKQMERHSFPECLNLLCDYAVEQGQINDTIAERDLFDTRLMGNSGLRRQLLPCRQRLRWSSVSGWLPGMRLQRSGSGFRKFPRKFRLQMPAGIQLQR